jgi:hypothetical protein
MTVGRPPRYPSLQNMLLPQQQAYISSNIMSHLSPDPYLHPQAAAAATVASTPTNHLTAILVPLCLHPSMPIASTNSLAKPRLLPLLPHPLTTITTLPIDPCPTIVSAQASTTATASADPTPTTLPLQAQGPSRAVITPLDLHLNLNNAQPQIPIILLRPSVPPSEAPTCIHLDQIVYNKR